MARHAPAKFSSFSASPHLPNRRLGHAVSCAKLPLSVQFFDAVGSNEGRNLVLSQRIRLGAGRGFTTAAPPGVRRRNRSRGTMNLAQTASLCILVAGTGVTWQASQARAQDQWTGGAPVFQSDVEQRERE